MKLNEILKGCNIEYVIDYTKLLLLSDGCADLGLWDYGPELMIRNFCAQSPSYILSSKFQLFISNDPMGPLWALENMDFKGDPSGNVGILGECDVDDFRFFNILLVPWSELLSMECNFSEELDKIYLEHALPFLFFDLAAVGFEEPFGEAVDEKVNNLLGIL